jgi:glycosyltransferase involved in cell wall biosynthesis
MMRIGIDCRFGATHSGIGTYVRGLTEALTRLDVSRHYVLFVRSRDEHWLTPLLSRSNVSIEQVDFAHYSFAEHLKFPKVLKQASIDLLFVPHFNVPCFCPVPFACTIHDLILHRYPNEASFLKRMFYRFLFARSVKKAKKIAVISAATKKDLLEFYPSTSQKTTVIHLGVNSAFTPRHHEEQVRIREKYGLKKRFFVYVGNNKEHKNVPVLVEAFLRTNLANFELILVSTINQELGTHSTSSGQARNPAFAKATAGRQEHIRVLSSMPSEDLPALYSAATACVTATKAEGFCLPLIEAMACGTPVLATDVGSIPEVTAGHALLCSPTVEALAEGMLKLSKDEATPDRRIELSTFAKRYSWDETARRTMHMLAGIA